MAQKRDHAQLQKRRQRAARMFERNVPVPEVGRRLGVARQVVYRWHAAWEGGGEGALVSKTGQWGRI